MRYYMPPALRGVVIFSHGTGGSSNYIESPEAFALALALVQKGYGVLGTEAEEVVAGDLNNDGKIRWAVAATSNNVDMKNLQVLLAGAEAQGLIPAGTPKFALGMSAGGSFSHFLGTVGATSVANSFPQLRFNAVLSYCADATASKSATLSTTPSAWFMCGAEDNPEVSLQEARDNEQTLRGRGIPTDYVEHPPSPLYDERFTRIPGISADTSAAMAVELRTAGFVDAAGFVSTGDWEFDSSCGVRTLKGSALDNPVYTVRRGGTILGAVPGQEPKAITKGGMRATQPPPKVAVDASVAFESWFDLLTGTCAKQPPARQ